jgi:hypothetical protein
MHAVEKTDIEEMLVIVTRLAANFEPRLLEDVGRYRASAKVMIQIRGTLHDIVEEGWKMMSEGKAFDQIIAETQAGIDFLAKLDRIRGSKLCGDLKAISTLCYVMALRCTEQGIRQ